MAIGDERWYFTKEELENSPSRRCGIDAEKELSYRQQAANLIQDIGQKLKVTQLVINTAIVYMHRFYTFNSFTKFHRNAISSCAVFLAAKVEEQPRKLEHVIKVSHLCIYRESVDTKSELYQQLVSDLVYNENLMLRTLGFNLNVQHPHTTVVNCCQLVKANKDLAQTSYFMATNSLHLTTMCLQYKPTVVACICIYFVCKWGDFELSKSSEDKDWWTYIDQTVTHEMLERLTAELISIFEKCPSRLKKILSSGRLTKQLEAGKSALSQQQQQQQPQVPGQPNLGHATHHHHHHHHEHRNSLALATSGGQQQQQQYQQQQHQHAATKGAMPPATSGPAAARASMPILYGSQPPPVHASGAHHPNMPKLDPGKTANINAINRNGSMPSNVPAPLPASKPSTSNNTAVISSNIFNNNSNSGGAYNEQMFEMQMQMFSSDSNDNSDYGQSSSGQAGAAAVAKTASNLFDEFKMEFSDDENDDGNTIDGNTKRPLSLTSTLMMNDTVAATANDKLGNSLEPPPPQQHHSTAAGSSNFDFNNRTQSVPRLVPPPFQQSRFAAGTTDLAGAEHIAGAAPSTATATSMVANAAFQPNRFGAGTTEHNNPLLNQQLGPITGGSAAPTSWSLGDTSSSYPPPPNYPLSHAKLPPALAQHSAIAMAAMATATATVPSIGFIDQSKKLLLQQQQQQQQHQLMLGGGKTEFTLPPPPVDQDESSGHSGKHKEKKKHKEKHKHKDKHKHKHKHKEKDRDRDMTLLSSSSPGTGQLKLKISKKKLSCDEPGEVGGEKGPVQPIKLKISFGKADDHQQQPSNKKRKASDVSLPQFTAATIAATKVAKKI